MIDKWQAIYAMNYGMRVRHTSFTSEEWVTSKDGMLVFEDGIICDPRMFWADRQGDEWKTGWDILFPDDCPLPDEEVEG